MAADAAVAKARVRLQVLCVTIRTIPFARVSEMYVIEYEDILLGLREAGVDVRGFGIPDSALLGLNDGDRDCHREFFVMRLAGLLLHLAQVSPGSAAPDIEMAERILIAFQPGDDEPPF